MKRLTLVFTFLTSYDFSFEQYTTIHHEPSTPKHAPSSAITLSESSVFATIANTSNHCFTDSVIRGLGHTKRWTKKSTLAAMCIGIIEHRMYIGGCGRADYQHLVDSSDPLTKKCGCGSVSSPNAPENAFRIYYTCALDRARQELAPDKERQVVAQERVRLEGSTHDKVWRECALDRERQGLAPETETPQCTSEIAEQEATHDEAEQGSAVEREKVQQERG